MRVPVGAGGWSRGEGYAPLVEHLRLKLEECGGVMAFDDYMECCLYAPGLGYYSRSQVDPGRGGDFYTSVATGPVFGSLLADEMARRWRRDFSGCPLHLVEQGAHGGQLAWDILQRLQERHGDLWRGIRCTLIEPRAGLRQRQQEKLSGMGTVVDWVEKLDEIDTDVRGMRGPVFFTAMSWWTVLR
ncbi:MAG: hypothetical protein HC904_08475 [Blastochloris sp.]|nr:hypothetical protein [Blastochloris sp.]